MCLLHWKKFDHATTFGSFRVSDLSGHTAQVFRGFTSHRLGSSSGANFHIIHFFPLQTYFYAKSHLLSMLKPKKATAEEKYVIGPRLHYKGPAQNHFFLPTNAFERGKWEKSQSEKRTGTDEASSARLQLLEIGALHTPPSAYVT